YPLLYVNLAQTDCKKKEKQKGQSKKASELVQRSCDCNFLRTLIFSPSFVGCSSKLSTQIQIIYSSNKYGSYDSFIDCDLIFFYAREIDFTSMASQLRQLQSKATQASRFVAEHGAAYYKQLLEQNKEFIQEPPTVEKCNLLAKQLFYTRLASIPGRRETFLKEYDYVKQLWNKRHELKVEDVSIGALFGLECFAWFCAGEVIGRGFTFTGYYV
ncbi:hypothetical protein AKJ16_DCAP14291, partial [Drosera capensis]